jgi:hypothetical protein
MRGVVATSKALVLGELVLHAIEQLPGDDGRHRRDLDPVLARPDAARC